MTRRMSRSIDTPPFAPFEWMLALRYLRARRKEGFISVIAGFSFVGILLGVATLIIVMAVMNGFRQELLDKILGLNGHLLIQPLESSLTDWQDVAARIAKVPNVRLAAPIVEGQALASSPYNSAGVLVRGIRLDDLKKLPSISNNIKSAVSNYINRLAVGADVVRSNLIVAVKGVSGVFDVEATFPEANIAIADNELARISDDDISVV